MTGFKVPSFQDRAAAAREAKQRALEKMRNKPVVDAAVVAERLAAAEAKEAAAAERRAARQAEIERKKAAKEELRAKAAAEAAEAAERAAAARRPAPPPVLPTPAELKAARDARYAARKARQRG